VSLYQPGTPAVAGDVWHSPDGAMELRCGRWQDVLADVEACDAVVMDPPYSERTHAGQAERFDRAGLGYVPLDDDAVACLVDTWGRRTRAWMVCMTDDVLCPAFRSAFREACRFDFAPVPVLQHKPRLQGDGPGSGAVWMCVSRPRSEKFMRWGSLPCWYESAPERGGDVLGAKPLPLMRAIVRDYSRPGDLIVDPYAGGATTLLAAAMEGRRAIGSECDPRTYALAVKRLASGYQPNLFSGDAKP